MIKALLFDFDNTLVKTREAIRIAEDKAFSYWSRRAGIPKAKLEQEWKRVVKEVSRSRNPRKRFREYSYPLLGKRLGIGHAGQAHAIFRQQIKASLKPYPGALALLNSLRQYRLAIFTETPRTYTIAHARKTRILEKFDFVITSTETGVMKPSNRYYRLALRRLKLRPADCIVVGDDPIRDIEPANKLGFRTIVFRSKSRHADYRVGSLSQIPAIVKSLS